MQQACNIIVLRALLELIGSYFVQICMKAGPDLVIFFDMVIALYDMWGHWKPVSDLKLRSLELISD